MDRLTPEEEQQIVDELLNTELNLDVPNGWCHKCGRISKENDSER